MASGNTIEDVEINKIADTLGNMDNKLLDQFMRPLWPNLTSRITNVFCFLLELYGQCALPKEDWNICDAKATDLEKVTAALSVILKRAKVKELIDALSKSENQHAIIIIRDRLDEWNHQRLQETKEDRVKAQDSRSSMTSNSPNVNLGGQNKMDNPSVPKTLVPSTSTSEMTPNLQNAVVFCGNTGVGKSYICNRIFGLYNVQTRFKSSSGVTSETSAIQHAQVTRPDGKTFTIIDTPGFFDNHDPAKTAEVDGANMCKFVAALEACSNIYAIVFIFSERFSAPHKIWFDRIRGILTPGRAGHIILLHNKVTLTLEEQIENKLSIKQLVENQGSIEYHWLDYNPADVEVQKLVDSIAKLAPFKLTNLVVPEICYEREETGAEYTEVIAEPTTKDEGHFEVQTKDSGHYLMEDKDTSHWETVIKDKGHMVTETTKGGRRYLVAGPKDKTTTTKWVPNPVAEEVWVKGTAREQVYVPGTTEEKVWVQKNVTRRTVGTYQNVFKIRFDGSKDLSEKKLLKTTEEVY